MWISSNSYVVSWMIAFIGICQFQSINTFTTSSRLFITGNMFKIPDAMLDLTFLAVGGCLPGHFYYQI